MNAAKSQGSEPCSLGGRKLYEMATLRFFNRGRKTAFLKSKLLYYLLLYLITLRNLSLFEQGTMPPIVTWEIETAQLLN